MANYNIKIFRYTPGVFDQWGFEIQELNITEDNLNTVAKDRVLVIDIKYVPNPSYGARMAGYDKYLMSYVGNALLDIAQWNNNMTRATVRRLNTQVGGEVLTENVRTDNPRFDPARIFSGVTAPDITYLEADRRAGGVYPPPPE